MKKVFLCFLLICATTLVLGGCSAGVPPHQDGNIFIYSGSEVEKQYALTSEDERIVFTLLEEGDWNESGTSDCVIAMPDGNIYYHSSCGTFNDSKNNRCLTLKGDDKAAVDAVFERYIPLGGPIPPKAK